MESKAGWLVNYCSVLVQTQFTHLLAEIKLAFPSRRHFPFNRYCRVIMKKNKMKMLFEVLMRKPQRAEQQKHWTKLISCGAQTIGLTHSQTTLLVQRGWHHCVTAISKLFRAADHWWLLQTKEPSRPKWSNVHQLRESAAMMVMPKWPTPIGAPFAKQQ